MYMTLGYWSTELIERTALHDIPSFWAVLFIGRRANCHKIVAILLNVTPPFPPPCVREVREVGGGGVGGEFEDTFVGGLLGDKVRTQGFA